MRGEVCVVVLLGVVGSIGCSTEHGKSLDLVHENDVSGLEIDEPAEVADATASLDALRPIGHAFCAVEVPTPNFGPDDSCGRMVDGLPQTGCWFDYRGERVPSMLCDLNDNRCQNPVSACADGWCYVPPARYLAGESDDVHLIVEQAFLSENFDSQDRKEVRTGFFVQDVEVGWGDFEAVMGYSHPNGARCPEPHEKSKMPPGRDCPAAISSIFEAMEYANRLGMTMGLPACYELEGCGPRVLSHDGMSLVGWSCETSHFVGPGCRGLRLPTHSEAELMSRAGAPYCLTEGPIASSNEPFDPGCEPTSRFENVAWYCANARSDDGGCGSSAIPSLDCLAPQRTARLNPNPFGIYDLQGNMAEVVQKMFCAEPPCDYRTDSDPDFDEVVSARMGVVTLGAGFRSGALGVCSMARSMTGEAFQNYRFQKDGFRLVRTNHDDCGSLDLAPR